MDVSFSTLLDWEAFSIRIPEADAERLPELLHAVPEARVAEMQAALARVWHRFAWSGYRAYHAGLRGIQQANRQRAEAEATQQRQQQQRQQQGGGGGKQPLSLPASVPNLEPGRDDAFSTLMQWLHWRRQQLDGS